MRVLGGLRRLRTRAFAWRLRAHARVVRARVDTRIDPSVRLRGRVHLSIRGGSNTVVEIGPRAVLERGTLLHLGGGAIRIGERTQIRAGCVLRVREGELIFRGENVLSYYSTVHCDGLVEVGRMTIVGEHTTISDSNHRRPDEPSESMLHSFDVAPVRIGGRGWIGTKSCITAGVTIGDDVVVGANAVVVSDLPSGVFAGGVPARVIRDAAR